MNEYKTVVEWNRDGAPFVDNRYSRAHRWVFDGGIEVPASSSPHVVPVPLSLAAAVDPEEAFVASLSSCHMLWFLHFAARHGLVVERYRDEAIGLMGKGSSGTLAMTHVTLHPEVEFTGHVRPSRAEQVAMHREAHEQCFIARSVRSEVSCEPLWRDPSGAGQ